LPDVDPYSSLPVHVRPGSRGFLSGETAEAVRKAKVIYGESSGVYPRLKPGPRLLYNPANWDMSSLAKLQEARRKMAVVSERNSRTDSGVPDGSNPIEQRAWRYALEAAREASSDELPPTVYYFLHRQQGKGPQDPPPDWGKVELHESLGPFRNTSRGAAPSGPGLYIDLYRKDPGRTGASKR
jgi:hypothetical protein